MAIDISTAFLQGGALEREVFVRPPAEMQLSGKLLRLRKAVSGLVDAPLHWYHALHNGLLSLGARSVPFDAAIYLFDDGDALRGWVAVHVDDISVAGANSFLDKIVDSLTHLFLVGSIKRGEYVYCGVRLRCIRDDRGQLVGSRDVHRKYSMYSVEGERRWKQTIGGTRKDPVSWTHWRFILVYGSNEA